MQVVECKRDEKNKVLCKFYSAIRKATARQTHINNTKEEEEWQEQEQTQSQGE